MMSVNTNFTDGETYPLMICGEDGTTWTLHQLIQILFLVQIPGDNKYNTI